MNRRRVLFVTASSRFGSSGRYLFDMAAALQRLGWEVLVLSEGPAARGGPVPWRRFRIAGGAIDSASVAAALRFAPGIVYVIGCRVKAMVFGMKIAERAGAALAFQAEDDDVAPFENYYPDTRARPLAGLLSAPLDQAAEGFATGLDWDLTARLWTGANGYRLVEPAVRTVLLARAALVSAIWDPLAAEMATVTGREAVVFPPVADLERLRGRRPGLPRLVRARRGAAPSVYFPGTTYEYADDVAPAFEALARLGASRRLSVIVSGHNRASHAIFAPLRRAAGITLRSLPYVGDARYLALIRAADVICVPGRTGRFNRLRFPSRLTVAAALGSAIVTYREGLAGRIADPEEMLFVAGDQVEAYHDAFGRLLDDAALRERLGEGAARFADRELSAQKVASRLAAAMERALSQPAPARALPAPFLSAFERRWRALDRV